MRQIENVKFKYNSIYIIFKGLQGIRHW